MRDVTFSEAPRAELGSLQIDNLLYQARPTHDMDQILRSVLRERRAFLLAFVIVLLLGVTYLVVASREYTAEATVMAAPRYPDLSRTDSVLNPTGTPEPVIVRDPDIEGEIQLMSSPTALRRVVQQLHLDQPPAGLSSEHASFADLLQGVRIKLGLDSAASESVSWSGLAGALLDRFGIEWGGEKPAPQSPERSVSLAAEQLYRKLKVAPIGRSTMIKVEYVASDPKLAAAVATAMAQNYINTRYQERREAAANASEYLQRHTAELRKEVVEAESRLAAFRAGVLSRGRDTTQLQNEMKVLGERIVAARADQQKAESRLATAEERVKRDGPLGLLNWETGPGADEYLAQSRAVGEMRKEAAKLSAVQGPFSVNAGRLETEARNLERQLTVQAQTRLANLRMSVDAANREVASLEAGMRSMREEYGRLDAAGVQLSAFENAALAARTVYQSFVTRWKTTEQAGYNEAQNWLVSPAAVPPMPSKPSIPLVLAGSLVAALGAGFSSALYRDYRGGKTIRTLEDIERHMPGMRSLGLLPELPVRRCGVRDILAAAYSGSRPAFGEAARNVYAALITAVEREKTVIGGRIIAISSALPLEGKSGTTGAIAAAARASGKRVLVVDCDLRRPDMHRAVGAASSPGLAECIERGLSPRDVIREHAATGISVLPAGQTRVLPQRLLQSARLASMLAELRLDFDLILIDTPPILGLSDTKAVARLADHTVLAVCWSRTTWRAAKLATRMLAEAGVPVIGAVLTRVDVARLARFGAPEAEPYRGSYRGYYHDYYQIASSSSQPNSRADGPRA